MFAYQLVQTNNRETSKLLFSLCEENSYVTVGFSSQRASIAEFKSQRQHIHIKNDLKVYVLNPHAVKEK